MKIKKFLLQLYNNGDINFNIYKNYIEITIRIIKKCNQNCIFCSTNLTNNILSYESIISIFIYLKSFFIKKQKKIIITLSGGEPTLHPDFLKILAFLSKNRNITIRIETNSILFSSKEFSKRVEAINKNIKFFISFHSHIKNIYNSITRSQDYYKSIDGINNIFRFFKKENIEFNHVINKLNYKNINYYLTFLNNFPFKEKINLVFSTMLPVKTQHLNYIVKYTNIIKELNKINFYKFNNIKIDNIFDGGGGYCQLPFCLLRKINLIDKNLDKYIINPDPIIGNNIMYKNKQCKKCKYYKFCLGIPLLYYKKYGDSEISYLS